MQLIIEMAPYNDSELEAFARWLQPSLQRKIRWSWQIDFPHPRLVSDRMPEATAAQLFRAMKQKATDTYGSGVKYPESSRFYVEDYAVRMA